ncbi:bifunctional DNA primase/polymerase [Streptomyces sp. Y1]|uniref:Bifunctional DNA primase/polymerase n=1 Tax=Streptomyces sp. Y1 TaxID=3238634 RepID=A0AB39TLS4_9ACTN
MTLRTTNRHHRPKPAWTAARALALAAAERGLSVFPLSPSKLPAVASAHRDQPNLRCTGQCGALGHGVHDATTNPARIRALFAAAPWATGYGIACGRAPHHLIGVDLDVKNGLDGIAALAALAENRGFTVPDTVTVATPTGGRHLWLTAPASARVPNSASKHAPGVDVRGSGGYLVGPGSLGTRGYYRYAADTDPSHIAPAPTALLAVLTPPPAPPARRVSTQSRTGANGALDGLARFVSDAGPGETNNRLFWAACRAFENPRIDPLRAERVLLDAAVAKGHPEREAAGTIASARRRSGASR